VLIGANFFEAAHEREYRNALVFQRKYDDAVICNAAILRLLGAGTAQLMGGFRQESLTDLGEQLAQYLPADLLADFNGIVQTISENNDLDSVTAQSTAVDRWTHAIAAFASQQDGQLDLSEALPK
jgi:sulfite reductase (NADPH) hemoprotein beta-component